MKDKNLKNQNLENQEFESKINKELNEEILGIYRKIKKDISKAISGYKKAWKGTEKEILQKWHFVF